MNNDSYDEDESDRQKFEKQAEAVSRLFRHKPYNLIKEMEKLGFTYVVDENEDAEEIAEERATRSTTANQAALVSFLEGAGAPDEHWLALWRDETRKDDALFPLWRRYFRSGSAQLKNLILFGLDRTPTDRALLDDLAFLHSFLPMPKELLARATLACDQENDPQRFKELAIAFDDNASSFGYDALIALRERCAGDPAKAAIIDELLAERATYLRRIL
jgi:hypothetical protein